MDDFVELHTIKDMKEDAAVKVVDEPYSVREARIHIRRLRDLLSTSLYQSSFTATDNLSLSLCTTIAGLDPEGMFAFILCLGVRIFCCKVKYILIFI